jgi:hypothetical protein
VTYLGDDGREHRSLGPSPGRRVRWVTKRSCDGWPELGSCSSTAMRGCDYCRECETLRRAHGGEADLTEAEDERDAED